MAVLLPGDVFPSPVLHHSRREFLGRLALGGVGLALLGHRASGDEEARPWYAWLSDIHIPAEADSVHTGQNTTQNLRAVVADILAQPGRPRGVVITGDLAVSKGQPGDYQTLNGLLEPLRRERIPIHLVLGNHDRLGSFREVLHAEPPADPAVADKQVAIIKGPGLRFLLLDSDRGDGATGGRLGERQIGWLKQTLDAEPTTPTILFLHHPPAPVDSGLEDAKDFLLTVQPRKQVKMIVFGHSHEWSHASLLGLHFVNLPAVAYAFKPDQPLGWVRFQPTEQGSELTLRCIGGDRSKDGEHLDLKWRTTPQEEPQKDSR